MQRTPDEVAAFVVNSRFLWHQRYEVAPGVVTPGVSDVAFLSDRAEVPQDLAGMRVLDVGTTNGCTALDLERRGADQVIAVDIVDPGMFGATELFEFLGSSVQFVQASVYELSDVLDGAFDLVIFWGVLYHLRHPLLALDSLRAVTSGTISVESAVADCELGAAADLAVARFYRLDELGGDSSNWFAPSVAGLVDWVRSCGFDPSKIDAWPIGAPTRAMVNATAAHELPEYQRVSYEVPLRAHVSRSDR